MNLKNGMVFTSKFVGTGSSSYEKRIYRAAVSQRLRNTVLEHIYEDYHKANMFSTPIRSSHTFEVGAWFRKPSFNKYTHVMLRVHQPTQKRDKVCSPAQHALSPTKRIWCCTAAHKTCIVFLKYARNQKLPAVKFKGLIDTYSYIWCHIKFLGVKVLTTIIVPVVMYGCETWSLTLTEERKLMVFENMVLRRIFGPRMDEVMGEWRRLHNEELNDLYSPNIVRVIKSRRMRWAGHVARMGEERGVYRVLVRQMSGYYSQRRGTARTSRIVLSMYCVYCLL